MSEAFDPYFKWLGIRDPQRPPNHYRLLGLELFETDSDVIETAADRQMAHVRKYQSGAQSEISQQVLNELASARLCLLTYTQKAAYDSKLRATIAMQQPSPTEAPTATPPSGASTAVPAKGSAPGEPKRLRTRAPIPTVAAFPPDELATPSINLGATQQTPARKAASQPNWILAALAVGGVLVTGAVALVLLRGSEGTRTDGNIAKGPTKTDSVKTDSVIDASRPPSNIQRNDSKGTQTPSKTPPPAKPTPPVDQVALTPNPTPMPPAKLAPEVEPATPATNVVPDPLPERPELDQPSPPDARSDDAATRQPIPDEADRQEALKLLQTVFKDDIAKAKAPAAQAAIAKRMLDEGRPEQGKPEQGKPDQIKIVERYVLLDEARRLASDAGDVETAFGAIDELAKSYDIEAVTAKSEVLANASKRAKATDAQRGISQHAANLIDEALAAENVEAAAQLAQILGASARKARHPELIKQIAVRTQQVQEFKKLAEKVESARQTLADKPDDPTANLTLGRFMCLAQGNWDAGLPFLTRGSDQELAQAAAKDLEEPSESADQIAAGDAWWNLAERESGTFKDRLRGRAGLWYALAVGSMPSGIARAKLEKRLDEVSKSEVGQQASYGLLADTIVIANQNNGNRGNYGTQQCNVVLYLGDREVWRQNDLTLQWSPNMPAETVVKPAKKRFDRVRVEVTRWHGDGGGLTEIEIMQGRKNIAPVGTASASGFQPEGFFPGNVIDGIRTSEEYQHGYWVLPPREAGWVEINLELAAITRAASARTAKGKTTADAIAIWNTHNGNHGNYGAKKCNVTLSLAGKPVWNARDLEVPWSPVEDRYLLIRPTVQFDHLRVEITEWNAPGAGLAEIEILRGEKNLARTATITASSFVGANPVFAVEKLIDGTRSSRKHWVGYWLPDESKPAWIELKLPPQK